MDSIPCPYSYGPSLLIVNVIIIERYSVITEMAFVFCGGPYTLICPEEQLSLGGGGREKGMEGWMQGERGWSSAAAAQAYCLADIQV